VLPFLLAAGAWADEAADRTAIVRTVTALNDPAQRADVFAKGTNAAAELLRLGNAFPIRAPAAGEPPLGSKSGPTVEISHEPWGEATIWPAAWGMALAIPRVESGPIQFLNPEVALVEGTGQAAGRIQSIRILFVMLREGGEWKIGAIRILKTG